MRTAALCRITALAIGVICAGGCSRTRHDSAPNQAAAQPSIEPGSNATPTNDASFQLMAADVPARFATLREVIVQAGNRCASVTRGVLEGGLDGTDEWRVDCSDSGSWQLWFSNDTGTEVKHCSNKQCS